MNTQKTSTTQHTQFLEQVFKRKKLKPRQLHSEANSKVGTDSYYQFNNNFEYITKLNLEKIRENTVKTVWWCVW
jgi:hypothetical protein